MSKGCHGVSADDNRVRPGVLEDMPRHRGFIFIAGRDGQEDMALIELGLESVCAHPIQTAGFQETRGICAGHEQWFQSAVDFSCHRKGVATDFEREAIVKSQPASHGVGYGTPWEEGRDTFAWNIRPSQSDQHHIGVEA